jgi:hypothetical protein
MALDLRNRLFFSEESTMSQIEQVTYAARAILELPPPRAATSI